MATYSQTPGLLNIKGVVGAHFSCQLDFGTSLVGYTFDSAIVLQDYPALQEQEITVTVDDAAEGIITLSLTSTQTSALRAISRKKWYLNWTIGGIKQTILAGVFQLSNIPLGQNVVTSTGVTINTQDVDITLSAFSNAALDGKQPLDADLTAIAGLSPSNDDFIQRKSGAWVNRTIAQIKSDLAISNIDNTSDLNKPLSNAAISALSYKVNTNQISSFGYTLVDDADASSARTTLGLGTAATQNSSSFQAGDSDLTAIAALSPADDDFIQRKSGAWTNRTIAQVKSDLAINNVNNTSDADKPVSTATQTALDLKLNSSTAASTYQPLDSDLTSIADLTPSESDFIQRKSGAWANRTISQVRSDLSINNVNNTSDLDKPVSNATQTALSYKVDTSQISTFGYSLINDADAATARTTLGLGTAATQSSSSFQPGDADLTAIAAIAPANGDIIQRQGGAWARRTQSQFKEDLALNNVNNTSDINKPLSTATINALSYKVNTSQISTFGYSLVDDADAATARATLGLGTISTQNANNVNVTGGTISGITDLALADGGTGGSLTAVNGGVVYSGASAFAITPAGTSGQLLQSNGTSAPSWTSLPDIEVGTAARATINNNTSSNRDFFPVFAYQSANTGSLLYGDSAKLKYNPSNGYLVADGFVVAGGDIGIYESAIHWSGNEVLNLEEYRMFDPYGSEVASWGDGNGMYVEGIASQNVPLRLFDTVFSVKQKTAYDIVTPSNSSTTNGANLRTAYTSAKALTPGNSALSATNRATVLLLPGKYDLGTTPLTMDTEFVDLVGISSDPKHVLITSQINTSDTGTVVQTVDNVIIRNVTIDLTGTPAGSGAGRTAAYFPGRDSTSISAWTSDGATATITSDSHGLQTGDSVRITGSGNSDLNGAHTVTRIDNNSFTFPSTVNDSGSIGTATERFDDTYIENCVFSGTERTRRAAEYAGTYKKCICDGSGLGYEDSIASGYFEDCETGAGFGSTNGSVASGTFIRCKGGAYSFGSSAGGNPTTATGTFTDCEVTNVISYNGTFTGTMRRCRFVCTGSNNNALNVGTGAKIFDSTLIATGTGESITASSAATIQLAGCRMNKSINSNVSNSLGTLTESFNLIDSDID